MLLTIALLLATAFPSTSRTAWMSPQSFHLTIGMTRDDTVKALEATGWTPKRGRNEEELVVDYSDDKALTLEFGKGRLRSVRFELFAMLPEVRAAFDEQKTLLRKAHGEPKKSKAGKSVVVYDDRLPNILVVLSDDPESNYGKLGIGYLAVRYYDPVALASSDPVRRDSQK